MPNILKKSYKTYLSHAESQQMNLHTYEAMIDKEVFNLYEIDDADLEQILREQGTPAGYFPGVMKKSSCSTNKLFPFLFHLS
jgi:hypothetical protein